ncbi:Catabolic L-serine/threonine dehydratase [Escovopsis weberi]|uniref:L-serine ammonia-lyase n=1 Tax=Escovopsis weberi TaxID=150374 RepID=A0A0M8N2A2_ESCWE|nr:Catabolic L-serine/threonine dehydratase [Escovopsis weberi]
MGSIASETKLPWVRTPCVASPQLSRVAGWNPFRSNIFLKLDNLQPSGSFKSRGIGNFMIHAAAAAAGNVHFYCVSGGNAGLACASSALALRKPCTIVIPLTTSDILVRKLRDLGARVVQAGKDLRAADRHLRDEFLARDPSGVYVSPYDHPRIWDGAATIVSELRDQVDAPIDAIVCSVGGGGLFNGLMQGVESYRWSGRKPAVVAVETEGADSLNACVRAGAHVALPGITSIATSLGVSKVSEETWRWMQTPNARSVVVSDADAAISCVRFADDARLLVEVSCGAALAALYRGDLRDTLGRGLSDDEWAQKNVVMIVCGGSGVSLHTLDAYREKYAHLTSIKV